MKILKLFFPLVSLVFIGWSSSSPLTNQFGDEIMYNGISYSIYEYLMEPYFFKYPKTKPTLKVESSALDRGYIAYYEVVDNQLFVSEIKMECFNDAGDSEFYSVYEEVFNSKLKQKIDWKTGFLVIPQGTLLRDYSYPPEYSSYEILEVDKGEIIERRNYSNLELKGFKRRQFLAYKKTRAYKKFIRCNKKANQKMVKGDEMDFTIERNILSYTVRFLVD